MIFASFYYLLLLGLHILAIPLLLLFALKKKYKISIPARFFLFKNPPLKENGVWFHTCSFGEARAIKPLLKYFKNSEIRLTTTTQTGFREIQKYSLESRFLPFETLLPFWIKKEKVLIVLEAELWFMLFFLAKKRKTYTILLNARISTKSFPKYKKFKWFYKKIFENIDKVYAQSLEDKKRLSILGAKNIEVLGNIKLLELPKPTKNYKKPPNSLIIVAGSTHKNEEELILESFLEFKKVYKDAKLLIVPRHPERFEEVWKIIQKSKLSSSKLSENISLETEIILVNTLGELINFYKIADIVILGGSFYPIGGHNFAEAAQFGVKIISGEYIFNQRDILNSIDGVKIIKKDQLTKTLLNFKSIPKSSIKNKKIKIEKFLDEVRKHL